MAVDPQEVLAKVRVAKSDRPVPTPDQVKGGDPTAVGCPPHLRPGTKLLDPVTGQLAEVVAYARTRLPGPVP